MTTEIYNKNTEIFKKIYNSLVESRKIRGLKKKDLGYYTEVHHIIPRCLDGTDEDDNLVLLTYREHIIAHMLLARIYEDRVELGHVVYFMFHHRKNTTNSEEKEVKLSTKELEELRISSVEFLRSKFTGRECKPEWIEKAKETKRLKYNGSLSEKARINQALGRVGMVFSESRKENMSKALKGKVIVSEETRRKQSISHSKSIIDNTTGIIYKNVKEGSEKLGISYSDLLKLVKSDDVRFNYVNKSTGVIRKVIDPEGNIYDSVRQCGIKYNRDGKTIKKWIENYPERGFKYYD